MKLANLSIFDEVLWRTVRLSRGALSSNFSSKTHFQILLLSEFTQSGLHGQQHLSCWQWALTHYSTCRWCFLFRLVGGCRQATAKASSLAAKQRASTHTQAHRAKAFWHSLSTSGARWVSTQITTLFLLKGNLALSLSLSLHFDPTLNSLFLFFRRQLQQHPKLQHLNRAVSSIQCNWTCRWAIGLAIWLSGVPNRYGNNDLFLSAAATVTLKWH